MRRCVCVQQTREAVGFHFERPSRWCAEQAGSTQHNASWSVSHPPSATPSPQAHLRGVLRPHSLRLCLLPGLGGPLRGAWGAHTSSTL